MSGLDGFPNETVRLRSRDPDLSIAARSRSDRLSAGEVDRLVLRGAAGHLTPGWILPLNHHFHYLAYMLRIVDSLYLALPVKQYLKPIPFFLFLNRINHDQRRCVGPG